MNVTARLIDPVRVMCACTGSVRELSLRQAQLAKMRSLQDDYLVCLQEQDRLSHKLKTPSPVGTSL